MTTQQGNTRPDLKPELVARSLRLIVAESANQFHPTILEWLREGANQLDALMAKLVIAQQEIERWQQTALDNAKDEMDAEGREYAANELISALRQQLAEAEAKAIPPSNLPF